MRDECRYGGAIHSVVPSGEYGFILLPDGDRVLLHRSQLPHGDGLEAGAQVTFEVIETAKGFKAVQVELISGDADRLTAA